MPEASTMAAATATATRRTARRIVRGVGARGGAKYSGGLRGIFARPKRGGDQVAASIGNILKHGHAGKEGYIGRCKDDVPDRTVWDCRKRAKSAEKEKLLGQNHGGAPIVETLDNESKTTLELLKGLLVPKRESKERGEDGH